METLLKKTNLVHRAHWLVYLRWLAVVFLTGAIYAGSSIFKAKLAVAPLYITAAFLLAYNTFTFILLKYFGKRKGSEDSLTISRIITFQIFMDLIFLTAVLHYSGGVENPFSFYFVFHMVLASTILSRRESYFQATFAVLLFGLLIMFEKHGILMHYPLIESGGYELYRNSTFVAGVFVAFLTTLYLVVYMTTSISSQLRKQQAGMEEANKLLEQKDQLKNEYVARLTHDIKGHLAAIQSCLNLVNDRVVGGLNEKQGDLVERAYRRTVKCTNFVSMLLKLTRMKLTGEVDREYFVLKNAIFNALTSAEAKAGTKSIKIEHYIESSIDEVYGESSLVEETIMNLLFNAIKYTSEKGSVSLRAKDAGDSVLIEISDTGIGIPKDEIDKIFDEFYRASNARKVERDGTGLGLSLAKEVVMRHGGRIWAENNPQGGSKFSFTVPKLPQDK